MSKALKLFLIAILGCVLQTNVVQYISIGDVAPDLMISLLVALTSFCGLSGCFCTGALMIMFYDASVGYVMALNLVGYAIVSFAAPALKMGFDKRLVKWKHKSVLVLTLICLILTFGREILHVGYLFLIGSELTAMTAIRIVLCTLYTTAMVIPLRYVLRHILNMHLPERMLRFFGFFRLPESVRKNGGKKKNARPDAMKRY